MNNVSFWTEHGIFFVICVEWDFFLAWMDIFTSVNRSDFSNLRLWPYQFSVSHYHVVLGIFWRNF
jgi:hypothetical protein